jgi:sigma-B regulation protein RsbU (phosphoserine phosphatase)
MKEKILIVNDDEGVREIIQCILQNKGYATCEGFDGPHGIQQAILEQPDLILLDIMMPGMNGYEACQKLKAEEHTKDIPIIFLSSLTSSKDKIRGLELGAVDYIDNVMDHGELLARVQTQLQIKALAQALRNSNKELMLKQKSLEDDLQAASIIQGSFLPQADLKIGNCKSAFLWLPANKLGGDIFNVLDCGEGKVILYMIDVSGHDVPSALVTISVSQFLHQQNVKGDALFSPSDILLKLDQEYPFERFERYFTIFYLILDGRSLSLRYSCAGHPPAVLLKKNQRFKILELGGPIIGIERGMPYVEGTEALEVGDKIFLYTDGVIEAKNPQRNMYGLERLCDLLESMKSDPIDKIIKAVHTDLDIFTREAPRQDDISLFGFEFNGEI